jgi:heptosyltransferase-2
MRIAVRGTNWIGDAVMSVPALRELRRIFPNAHIALHTRSWAEGIFRDVDFLDEIITFEQTGSTLKNAVAQGLELRNRQFVLAILFPNSFASALAARLAGIPRRFGYAREARQVLLTDPIAVPDSKNSRHEVYYYLNLIAEVEKAFLSQETVMDRKPITDLPVSGHRREGARRILRDLGVVQSNKIVALGVGSANSRAKRWLPENYARLNDRLQEELGVDVVLIGSKDEINVSETVAKMSVRKPTILTGKTKLDEAVAILAEVDLLISNDMGLAHVAPAVGTKTLAIFGPTNPETTAPFSPNVRVIRKEVECSPCMLRDCPIDHRCMTRISVDEVFESAKAELTH